MSAGEPSRKRGRPKARYHDPDEPLSPESDPNLDCTIYGWSPGRGKFIEYEYKVQPAALDNSRLPAADVAQQFPGLFNLPGNSPPDLPDYGNDHGDDGGVSAADLHANLLKCPANCPLVYTSSDRYSPSCAASSLAHGGSVCTSVLIHIFCPYVTSSGGVQAGHVLCACL